MKPERNFMPPREFPVARRSDRNLVRMVLAGCMGAPLGGVGAALFATGSGALVWWAMGALGFLLGAASVSGIKPPMSW